MFKHAPVIILILGFVYSLWFYPNFFSASTAEITSDARPVSVAKFSYQEKTTADHLPERLSIPRIGVDTMIEYVGTTSEGAVGEPVDPTRAAWFTLGPSPGEKGTAIVSGHFGWKNEMPAVFDELSVLQIGDPIYVEDKNGMSTTFVVRNTRTYELNGNEDYLDIFYSNDDKAYLNLITCSGIWDEKEKRYSHRLVVFTEKE